MTGQKKGTFLTSDGSSSTNLGDSAVQTGGSSPAIGDGGSNPAFGGTGTARGNMMNGSGDLVGSSMSVQLTSHKLNGRNYLEWAQSVKLAIDKRGKIGHLMREISRPAARDPNMAICRSENSLVTVWLIKSMEPTIEKPHMFLPTAKDVWDVVREMYSNVENSSQIYELK